MARKKSTQELVAQVEKAAASEGASKRGRRKGSKNRKASGCDIDTKGAEIAINKVGNLIRGIEKATGVKFGRPQVMKLGSPGSSLPKMRKRRK